jgi:small-conductance mechanosensitive channel
MTDLTALFDLNNIGHLAIAMLSLIVSMMIKDIASSAVIGIRIYMSRSFNPGDTVYVDGQRAVIVAQDFKKTIFQIQDDRGTLWRYVENTSFADLNIEKIITPDVLVRTTDV